MWVDEPVPTKTNNDLVRQLVWDPVSQNELVQSRSMQRLASTGEYTTAWPVWAATDRRRDVVAMHYDLAGVQSGTARVRHSPYGVPEPVLAGISTSTAPSRRRATYPSLISTEYSPPDSSRWRGTGSGRPRCRRRCRS